MAAGAGGVAPSAGRLVVLRRWLAEDGFGFLLAEWMLCNVGQWGVVSVLSLYLLTTLRLAPGVAAALLLFATVSFRLTRFFVAPVLDRLPPRGALLLSVSTAALAYLALAFFPPAVPLMIAALPLVGAGYGSNALMVKALAAGREQGRLIRYGSINAALNAGAAIGPLLGTWLFLHVSSRAAFAMAGLCFAAAALVVLGLRQRGPAALGPPVHWLAALRRCLAIPDLRRALVFTALAFFLYSQLYAILPISATGLLGAPDALGAYFALNAILVIGAQIPISRRAARGNVAPARLVQLGYASFGAGFLLVWLWPSWQVAFLAVVVWSLAEMLVLPGIDATTAGALPADLRISGFSLASVATAAGEGGGSFVGVAAAGQLVLHHQLREWYGVLALCALAAIAIAVLVSLGRGAGMKPAGAAGLPDGRTRPAATLDRRRGDADRDRP
ncbi:MAG TPA: MFS transporter [Candidatus Eisenbacteria bacterium]|nr:MFS transporter [Candidatus Eisenbacteria bacterium]